MPAGSAEQRVRRVAIGHLVMRGDSLRDARRAPPVRRPEHRRSLPEGILGQSSDKTRKSRSGLFDYALAYFTI
jgi:hypothetical protein